MKKIAKIALGAVLALSAAGIAQAGEHPLGPNKEVNHLDIGAVWLQPITMDRVMGLPAAKADIHLETDIHAMLNNPHFQEGWWIPYLTVNYVIDKLNAAGKVVKSQKGMLMPMVADDGPHYGSNVKLWGPGKYRATFTILPPTDNKQISFGRHIDKETAAAPFWKPFSVSWTFDWAGNGKKGGY